MWPKESSNVISFWLDFFFFYHFLLLLVLYVFGHFGVVGRNIWLLWSECFRETLDCKLFGRKWCRDYWLPSDQLLETHCCMLQMMNPSWSLYFLLRLFNIRLVKCAVWSGRCDWGDLNLRPILFMDLVVWGLRLHFTWS